MKNALFAAIIAGFVMTSVSFADDAAHTATTTTTTEHAKTDAPKMDATKMDSTADAHADKAAAHKGHKAKKTTTTTEEKKAE